jgi:phenylpropionate dioxygenase-like ring-hydroxylating dioxygenase large terminal subunit
VTSNTDPQSDWGLPGWIYGNDRFFKEEQDKLLRPSWQIVCHLNDIPKPGDFHTLDFLGESIVVSRAKDGGVRAFTNVCRHRGARLVDGPSGHCGRFVCPYHAWTYDLEGRLIGVPFRDEYPALEMDKQGLVKVDVEVYRGFVSSRGWRAAVPASRR